MKKYNEPLFIVICHIGYSRIIGYQGIDNKQAVDALHSALNNYDDIQEAVIYDYSDFESTAAGAVEAGCQDYDIIPAIAYNSDELEYIARRLGFNIKDDRLTY